MSEIPPSTKMFGIGNPLLDISAVVSEDLLKKYDLKANSAILAEEKHMPLYDELVKNHNPTYLAGGSCLNTIRVAQNMDPVEHERFGYMGCIGKDDNGQKLKEKAAADGVFIHLMECDKPTGACACLITGQERTLVTKLEAANEYDVSHMKGEVAQALLTKSEAFYTTGFFITVSPDTLRLMAEHALTHNKPFMMNLSAEFIMQVPPFFAVFKEMIPFLDFVFGNETEAAALGQAMGWGDDIREIGAKLVQYEKKNGARGRTVVFTQGADPALVFQEDTVKEYPIIKLEASAIVDSNGAGDSFLGGFLSRFVHGLPMDECMAAGAYAAWVIIQQNGCTLPKPMPKKSFGGFDFGGN